MSIFEALYDLSIRLLTAPPKSEMGRLTLHHCGSTAEAETLVRSAVLTREMPGEFPVTRWGILRVFMRNLVNRNHPPMSGELMLRCLDEVSVRAQDEVSRTTALVHALVGNAQLSRSLRAVLDRSHAPSGSNDYLDWLNARVEEYRHLPVAAIDTERVLDQLRQIACDRTTKIPNMGIALASNLFADLGIRVLGKPDLHVLETMKGLLGVRSLAESACIREVIRVAKNDASHVSASDRFDWLTGGLFPRDVDRMMYVIGADDFHLDGRKLKRRAPARRSLMIETLIDATRATKQTRLPQPVASGSALLTATLPPQKLLLPTTADLPRWLRDWSHGRPIRAEDFFASRVVFYPGSGTDGQPVKFFGSRHAAHCFVFADYGISRDHVLGELKDGGHPFAGYGSTGRVDLKERDLTPNGWVPHIQPEVAQRAPAASDGPYAFIEVLERRPDFDDAHGPKRLAILFLCADGVAAFDALFCQATTQAAFAIVLQDHGWGGNWTRFGRGGGLEQVAAATQRRPEFLLVAKNTDVWAGYSVIEEAVANGGGMHRFERQLWRRDHPAECASANADPTPSQSENANREHTMPWIDVTLLSLQHAMAACEAIVALGPSERLQLFREQQQASFQPARNVHAWYGDRGPFEARPLIAAAYAHQFNIAPLTPKDFNGTDAHRFLEGLGFSFLPI